MLHARPALQKFRYDTINGEDKHAGDQAALRCAQNGPVLQLHCRRYTRGSVDVRIPRTRSRLLTAPYYANSVRCGQQSCCPSGRSAIDAVISN